MNESSQNEKYFGLYEGTVLINVDPDNRGRLFVNVPDVTGFIPNWAECCTPLAGPTGPPMGVYMVPPLGAGVWVTFKNGDPTYPIWMGCRFGSPSDVPPLALAGLPVSPNIVMQTLGQQMVMISDMPPTPLTGGIVLRSFSGAMIVVNDSGIYISNGQGATITMINTTIDFNLGALTIVK